MSFTDMLMFAAFCLAFVGFGVILAWGEHQTRHLSRDQGSDIEKGRQTEQQTLFTANDTKRE